MEECKNCPYDAIIKELQKDSERNITQHKEFYRRVGEIDTNLAVQSERYTNLLMMLTEIKVAVENIKERPVKKWDTVSMCVITTLIGAILGAIIKGLI